MTIEQKVKICEKEFDSLIAEFTEWNKKANNLFNKLNEILEKEKNKERLENVEYMALELENIIVNR